MPSKLSVEMHICPWGLVLVLLLVILDEWQRLISVLVMVVMLPVTHTVVAKVWFNEVSTFFFDLATLLYGKYSSIVPETVHQSAIKRNLTGY